MTETRNEVQFSVENVGPIERKIVSFRFGMNVIRGRNGRGKSTMLNCCEAYASGKPKGLTVHDGATTGRISGPGREIALRRRSTTTGEAELELVGNQNLASAFVNGGNFKDTTVRDNARMAACLQMFEIPTDEKVFVSLVGGMEAFDTLASPQTRACKDIVEFAERFRRDLQATARNAEAAAEREQQKALALRDSCRDIDLQRVSNKDSLTKAVEQAMQEAATAKANQRRYEEALRAQAFSRAQLAKLDESLPDANKVADLGNLRQYELDMVDKQIAQVDQEMAELRQKKQALQSQRLVVVAQLEAAMEAVEVFNAHSKQMQQLRELIQRPLPPEVTETEVAAAEQAVVIAQQQQEYGVLVRRAVEQLAEAQHHADRAKIAGDDAARYRSWADAIDDVLTEALAQCGIPVTWNQGRMLCKTKRGTTYVDELGEGERWCLVAIALAKFKPGSFFIVPQECWEALDPQNREMIHVCCVQHKIVGVTGLADEHEELVCEEFIPTLLA